MRMKFKWWKTFSSKKRIAALSKFCMRRTTLTNKWLWMWIFKICSLWCLTTTWQSICYKGCEMTTHKFQHNGSWENRMFNQSDQKYCHECPIKTWNVQIFHWRSVNLYQLVIVKSRSQIIYYFRPPRNKTISVPHLMVVHEQKIVISLNLSPVSMTQKVLFLGCNKCFRSLFIIYQSHHFQFRNCFFIGVTTPWLTACKNCDLHPRQAETSWVLYL